MGLAAVLRGAALAFFTDFPVDFFRGAIVRFLPMLDSTWGISGETARLIKKLGRGTLVGDRGLCLIHRVRPE